MNFQGRENAIIVALLFSWKARMIVYINPKTHIQTRQNAIFGHAHYAKVKTIFTYNED